jgi:hypothetical protein
MSNAKFYEIKHGAISIRLFALSLKQLQEREVEIDDAFGKTEGVGPYSKERLAKQIKWFTVSARRGNPNITEEQVASVIDLENMGNATRAIMGLFKSIKEDTDDSGESNLTPTLPQIGAAYTQG